MKIEKVNPILIVIFILFVSCGTNYKFTYFPADNETIARVSKTSEYVIKNDELFLCFTSTFKNTKVKIFENNQIVFNGIMNTKKNGRAETFKVNINSILIIYFEDIKTPLKITKNQMKLYKNIYIEKKKNKVTVEFNNGHKNLGVIPKYE